MGCLRAEVVRGSFFFKCLFLKGLPCLLVSVIVGIGGVDMVEKVKGMSDGNAEICSGEATEGGGVDGDDFSVEG